MKAPPKFFYRVSASFICFIIYLAFIGYTADHWPSDYSLIRYILIVALGLWFVWQFVVQPFRAGLK